jgi:hypothetical protein
MNVSFVRTLSVLFAFGVVGGVSLDHFAIQADASTASGSLYAQNRSGWLTVPAGTRILIRTTEPLSSARPPAGGRFVGVLETNLSAQGRVIAQRGTPIHGRISSANTAGGLGGSSHLTIELTDVILNGNAHPIVTEAIQWQGQGRGGNTARSVGVGAGLGSAFGAIAGRGRGALIGGAIGGGLGTASAAGSPGQEIFIEQGTLLEFRLLQPAPLPTR